MFVPENKVKNNKVVQGFIPLEYEIVTVEYDYQPYYELYAKSYDKAYKESQVLYSDRDDFNQLKDSLKNTYKVDPQKVITLADSYNIKEYDLSLLRKKIGAVFQDHRIFAASVAENVLADLYTDDKEELVVKSLERSTFGDRLKTLDKGIHTAYEGILSGRHRSFGRRSAKGCHSPCVCSRE